MMEGPVGPASRISRCGGREKPVETVSPSDGPPAAKSVVTVMDREPGSVDAMANYRITT